MADLDVRTKGHKMKPSKKVFSGIGALLLTTYFVIKCVALQIPATGVDKALFIVGGVLALLHGRWYWQEQKQNRQSKIDATDTNVES